ncbi:hypothetical protein NHN20_10360 [Riemerella anatipestifer]|uniref:hypothetical protein n=1 Tax=Riemerella anatipestifer TaxID=34085 RepID=UPI0020976ED4|nr:hypothetical protein [Riemerella anatipestifer]MCO7355901.1 hypothetical protein [Riemerella anatipestifer]
MIDGVKILCNLNPNQWTNNKNLSFRSWTDITTGEVLYNNRHADIKGLHLSIIDGEAETYCEARGSLPRYYNNGDHNAFDYDYNDFLTTCDLLKTDLSVSAETTDLKRFEFGLNINLPFDISNVYEAVKCYKMNIAGINKINGKRNGIKIDFQQYEIKIYDKGLHQTKKPSRLMRFEVVVKKMEYAKKLGVKTLADLQNKDVWLKLSERILEIWSDIIFIDKSLDYRQMTEHRQKKYLRFLDVNYWCNLNRNTYYKAKNDLKKFQSLYSKGINAKEVITGLFIEKLQKLTTLTPEEIGDKLTKFQNQKNNEDFNQKEQRLKNENWRQINHLDKGLKTGNILPDIYTHFYKENNSKNNNTNSSKKSPKKIPQLNQKNRCKCMSCKKELTNKRANAKFCGLKCKNQYNGKRRTKERQKNRVQEIKALKKLLPKLERLNLPLLVIYKADGLQYADHLSQNEIHAPKDWIRQIKKVMITNDKNTPPQTFTTLRAKQLIREITKINKGGPPE